MSGTSDQWHSDHIGLRVPDDQSGGNDNCVEVSAMRRSVRFRVVTLGVLVSLVGAATLLAFAPGADAVEVKHRLAISNRARAARSVTVSVQTRRCQRPGSVSSAARRIRVTVNPIRASSSHRCSSNQASKTEPSRFIVNDSRSRTICPSPASPSRPPVPSMMLQSPSVVAGSSSGRSTKG